MRLVDEGKIVQLSEVKQRTLQTYQRHFTGLQSALSNQGKKKAQANITSDNCTILPSFNFGIYRQRQRNLLQIRCAGFTKYCDSLISIRRARPSAGSVSGSSRRKRCCRAIPPGELRSPRKRYSPRASWARKHALPCARSSNGWADCVARPSSRLATGRGAGSAMSPISSWNMCMCSPHNERKSLSLKGSAMGGG